MNLEDLSKQELIVLIKNKAPVIYTSDLTHAKYTIAIKKWEEFNNKPLPRATCLKSLKEQSDYFSKSDKLLEVVEKLGKQMLSQMKEESNDV